MKTQPHATRFFTVLIAGFALLIVLLCASMWVGIDAMRSTESTASRLVEEQRATLRLIEDIQQEQDSLSDIFYSLAVDQSPVNRATAKRNIDTLEPAIQATLSAGLSSVRPEYWNDVRAAVDSFVAEGRAVIAGARPAAPFFQNHEALISALGKLVTVNFEAAATAEKLQADSAARTVRSSLILMAAALVTAVLGSFATVWSVSGMYRHLQWQRSELAQLSSRTMADQEAVARRFSRELHDEFGQSLSAIEACLVSIHHSRQYDSTRVEDALAMVKAAIGNARELSQLLRPSILDDFGLDVSLKWLADGFSQRTGIRVDYLSCSGARTDDDTETQLFRIAQEALTNVSRHSGATFVRMELERTGAALCLTVSDNGKGMSAAKPGVGMGLVGMRARSRAVGGTLQVSSSPGKGVTIRAEVTGGEFPNRAGEKMNVA